MKPFVIGPGHTGFNLDRCEEVILVDAWLRVRPRIPPDAEWHAPFEDRFFRNDKGVSGKVIEEINRHLRRLHMAEINFPESDWTDYMRVRGDDKIHARTEILAALRGRDRQRLVEMARSELDLLPAPIAVELKNELTQAEVIKRRREDALERSRQAEIERGGAVKAELSALRQSSAEFGALVRGIGGTFQELNGMFERFASVVEAQAEKIGELEAKIDLLTVAQESVHKIHKVLLADDLHRMDQVPMTAAHETNFRVDLPGAEQPDISHLNGAAFPQFESLAPTRRRGQRVGN